MSTGSAPATTLGALSAPAGRVPAPAPSPGPSATSVNAAAPNALKEPSAPALPHPVHEMHRMMEPPYDRVMRIVGTVLTAPFSFVRWIVSAALNVLRMVLTTALTFILTLPLRIAGLFGANVTRAMEIMKQVIDAPLALATGVVEGVLRAPEVVVGSAHTFLRDLFGGRYFRDPRQLISLFTQPIFGAIGAALAPIYYGVRNIDDTFYPPRPLTPEERAALAPDFEPSTLDSVRIHERGILHTLSMWGDANTQGHDIYVSPGSLNTSTLRHELVHTLQVDDTPGGFGPFVANYYATVLAQLPGSDGLVNAYENTPQEVEAYEIGGR